MKQLLKPIHLACEDDEMRPNLKLIEIKNNIAMATNGHLLVSYELSGGNSLLEKEQIEILNGKFIHMEVWKEIHKCDAVEILDDAIICHKDGIKKIFEFSEPNGEMFEMENVVIECKLSGEDKRGMVSYNPRFIEVLRKIFQTDTMHFSFSEGNKGTIVFPDEHSGIFAVLMPIYTQGVNRYFFLR